MHIIRSHFQDINLKIMPFGYLIEQLGNPVTNILSVNPFAVLRCPYQVVLAIIHSMTSAFECHAGIIHPVSRIHA